MLTIIIANVIAEAFKKITREDALSNIFGVIESHNRGIQEIAQEAAHLFLVKLRGFQSSTRRRAEQ